MLVYLAAPYSRTSCKNSLMAAVMKFSGEYMLKNKGQFIVSPLFNHFSLEHVPGLGSDWEFWKEYSEKLMSKCDKLIVLDMPETAESTGVQAEIQLASAAGIPIVHLPLGC